MSDLVITPKDGSTYITDASIDTFAWLTDKLGKRIDMSEWLEKFSDDSSELWPQSDEVLKAIEAKEGREYTREMTENVYNQENSFSDTFVFSVYAPEGSSDWMYADDVYVVVAPHRGGDPRGNYGISHYYKTDNLADGNFFDWVVGWYVVDAETEEPIERADKYDVGYSSNPSYELEKVLDEGGEWKDGAFHATMDGEPIIAYPEVR